MKKIILLIALFATIVFGANAQIVNDTTVAAPQEESMLMKVENWYANNMNYLSITLLMTLESS